VLISYLFTFERDSIAGLQHYGFRNDNGHFLSIPGYSPSGSESDFVTTVGIRWVFKAQYDQAGVYVCFGRVSGAIVGVDAKWFRSSLLQIRASSSCWAKSSCEYESGEFPAGLGAVVTNSGYSDWFVLLLLLVLEG
jgi:regulation of enolase protein 1 (concanavalin A-like superfamily)